MRNLIIFLMVLSTGCATHRVRSTDPVMRVTIDAQSMVREAYIRVQKSVFDSGKFIVVDRDQGFRAIAKEQELQHTTSRFGQNEKYALWGKMYGVGGIFVANEQCKAVTSIFHAPYAECVQTLSLVNATTGEIMAMAEVTEKSDGPIEPSWDKAIAELIDRYPHVFIDKHDPHKTIEYDSALTEYREKTVIENQKASPQMQSQDYLR